MPAFHEAGFDRREFVLRLRDHGRKSGSTLDTLWWLSSELGADDGTPRKTYFMFDILCEAFEMRISGASAATAWHRLDLGGSLSDERVLTRLGPRLVPRTVDIVFVP
ncbi:hypothetical protein OH807_40460 [Kitasatospora sp. NBC_01560]|uniref:hypothetical protein n=1 Tax=Kitasatospora sp. NBC_01560 TaxID=2975965 RepID=UPI003869B828